MSRIVSETQTFHPGGLEVLDANGTSVEVSNVNNFIGANGSTSSGSYAQYYLVTGTTAETFGWASMDCSALPRNITINNVTGKFKIYHSSSARYVSPRQIRPYYNNRQATKGYSVNLSATTSVVDLDMGTSWTRDMFDDLEIRLYSKRTTSASATSNYYVRPYGIDVTVEYEYTMYEFTCNSSLTDVGMLPSSGEAMSGDSYTVTITGISDISTVVIKDNGTDVTGTFTKSGNNYVKTYSNVDADHSITIEASAIPTIPSFVKKNSQYKQVSKAYKKNSNVWEEKSIMSVMWKINNTWTSTTSSMSGKTAFKTDV